MTDRCSDKIDNTNQRHSRIHDDCDKLDDVAVLLQANKHVRLEQQFCWASCVISGQPDTVELGPLT